MYEDEPIKLSINYKGEDIAFCFYTKEHVEVEDGTEKTVKDFFITVKSDTFDIDVKNVNYFKIEYSPDLSNPGYSIETTVIVPGIIPDRDMGLLLSIATEIYINRDKIIF